MLLPMVKKLIMMSAGAVKLGLDTLAVAVAVAVAVQAAQRVNSL